MWSVPGELGSGIDSLLTVQRQMVGVFGHQHLGQQTGGGQAFVDDVRIDWFLFERLAASAHPFAAHMAVHREHAGCVVQLIGYVLAHAAHGLLAALGNFGLVLEFLAWQLLGQWQAFGLTGCTLGGRAHLLDLFAHSLQVFFQRVFEQAALIGIQGL